MKVPAMWSRASSQVAGRPSTVGVGETAGRADRVVLGEALRAEPPAVHRVVGVALHGDGLAVADAEEHPAAHRAVAAGRAHPLVRSPAGAHRAEALVVLVRVALAAVAEAGALDERAERRRQGGSSPRAASRFGRTTRACRAAPPSRRRGSGRRARLRRAREGHEGQAGDDQGRPGQPAQHHRGGRRRNQPSVSRTEPHHSIRGPPGRAGGGWRRWPALDPDADERPAAGAR